MANNDFPVLIPYSQLCKLLDAPKRVSDLEKELAHQNRLIAALRGQLFEVIEKMREK